MPHPEKGYIYVLSERLGSEMVTTTSNLGDAILDIKFSRNIAVVSTKPGYASAISVIIDSNKLKDIIGTVAGDNNIIVVLHEEANRESVIQAIQSLFPTLKNMD